MALCVATAMVLASCGPSYDWAGEWKGRRAVDQPPGTDPSVAESLAVVSLSIDEKGRFKLNEEGFIKEGNVLTGGNKATLRIDRVLGRPIGNLGPEAVNLGGDRTVTAVDPETVTFERPGSDPIRLKRNRRR